MRHYLLGALLGLCFFVGWNCTPDRANPNAPLPPQPAQWEYKTFTVDGKIEKVDGGAIPSSLEVKDTDLNALGQASWELVGVWTEQETVFQNLGDSKYVTGFQPNVRDKRVVFVFKRTVKQ